MPLTHHGSIFCTALALSVAGCGDSGDDRRVDDGPVKYYSATFRQSQLVSLMSFDGGLVYGFYQDDFTQPQFPEFAYAGFFVASPSASAPDAKTRIGQDYRFNTRETVRLSLVDLHATDRDLTASIQSNLETEALVASRAPIDELSTDTSTLQGDYAVQARSTIDSRKGTASIDPAGSVRIDLPDGCIVTGSLNGRRKGNLYDAGLTFSASCSVANGLHVGHAFQRYSTRNTYVLLTSKSGSGVLLLLSPDAAPQANRTASSVRPTPSAEARPNGRPPGLASGAVDPPFAGPGASPSVRTHLDR